MTYEELKELLTLAAKAAGIPTTRWNDGTEPYSSGPGFIVDANLWNAWSNSADALALAVKLRMQIEVNERSVVVSWVSGDYEPLEVYCYPDSVQNEDYEIVFVNHEAAVRKAIVRMAAKIAKQK